MSSIEPAAAPRRGGPRLDTELWGASGTKQAGQGVALFMPWGVQGTGLVCGS